MEVPRSCTSDEVCSEEPPGFLSWLRGRMPLRRLCILRI